MSNEMSTIKSFVTDEIDLGQVSHSKVILKITLCQSSGG